MPQKDLRTIHVNCRSVWRGLQQKSQSKDHALAVHVISANKHFACEHVCPLAVLENKIRRSVRPDVPSWERLHVVESWQVQVVVQEAVVAAVQAVVVVVLFVAQVVFSVVQVFPVVIVEQPVSAVFGVQVLLQWCGADFDLRLAGARQ